MRVVRSVGGLYVCWSLINYTLVFRFDHVFSSRYVHGVGDSLQCFSCWFSLSCGWCGCWFVVSTLGWSCCCFCLIGVACWVLLLCVTFIVFYISFFCSTCLMIFFYVFIRWLLVRMLFIFITNAKTWNLNVAINQVVQVDQKMMIDLEIISYLHLVVRRNSLLLVFPLN